MQVRFPLVAVYPKWTVSTFPLSFPLFFNRGGSMCPSSRNIRLREDFLVHRFLYASGSSFQI